jgi:glycosyltransferase involved in cell wall biosynthesis
LIEVDDCSTDGTRQILAAMAALQEQGHSSAPARDGEDEIPLADLRFFFHP